MNLHRLTARYVLVLCTILLCSPVLFAQSRDIRGQRIVIDDNGDGGGSFNTITISAPPGGYSANHTVMVPEPDGSPATLLISNPVGGAGQQIMGSLTVEGELQLFPSGGSYYSAFLASGAQTENLTYTLPADYGTSGQMLTTDGAGGLSWAEGGVPASAPILTFSTDGDLSNNRVLTQGTGIVLSNAGTDDGALTIATAQNIATSASPTFAGLTLSGLSSGSSSSSFVVSNGGALETRTLNSLNNSVTVATDATLTGSGLTGSALGINLSNANTWSGQQTFSTSGTTSVSIANSNAGGTAATFAASGTDGIGLNVTGGRFVVSSLQSLTMPTGSGTLSAVNNNVALVIIADNSGTGGNKALTLPSGPTTGQIVIVVNNDANQDVTHAAGNVKSGKTGLYIYSGSAWNLLSL